MNMKKLRHEIKYDYTGIRYMSEYIDRNSDLLLYLVRDQKELAERISNGYTNEISKAMDLMGKEILRGRAVVDGRRKKERILPVEAVSILNNTIFAFEPSGIRVSLGVAGKFNIIQNPTGASVIKIDNIYITPGETFFKIRDYMEIYEGRNYSLAAFTPDMTYGFALIKNDSLGGSKGDTVLFVSYLDATGYYIDDASKYRNVTKEILNPQW